MGSDKCGPSLLCQSDLDLMQCITGCAVESIVGATGRPVRYFKFRPDQTTVNDVYGDACPVFDPYIEIPATINVGINEEEVTAYGNRNQGREDNNIERPDAILYIPTAALVSRGIVIDTENRDEFEAFFNGKWRRCNIIGAQYPEDLGVVIEQTYYLNEKG